jgi:hypothetical protein
MREMDKNEKRERATRLQRIAEKSHKATDWYAAAMAWGRVGEDVKALYCERKGDTASLRT